MALPSLGLGIGMQGQLKDYSEIIRAKERGKAAAQARKQSEEDKRLQKIRTQLDLTSRKPLLKVHQKEVEDDYMRIIDELYNSVENGSPDYSAISQSILDFNQKVAGYADQYQNVKKAEFSKNSGFGPDEISRLLNDPDPASLAEATGRPGSPFAFDPNTRNLSIAAYSQVPISEYVGKAFQDPNVYKNYKGNVRMGSKNFAIQGVAPQAVELTAETILTDPDLSKSLDNEYWNYLKSQGNLPDMKNPSWREEFNSGREDYLAKIIEKSTGGRAKFRNVTATGGGSSRSKKLEYEVAENVPIDIQPSNRIGDNKMLVFSYSGGTKNPNLVFEAFDGKKINAAPYAIGDIAGAPALLVQVKVSKSDYKTGRTVDAFETHAVPFNKQNKANFRNEYGDELVKAFERQFGFSWGAPDPTNKKKPQKGQPGITTTESRGSGVTSEGKSRWSKNVVKE